MAIRIAFKMTAKNSWYGGEYYLTNIFYAINLYNREDFEILIYAPPESSYRIPEDDIMHTSEIITYSDNVVKSPLKIIYKSLKKIFSYDINESRILRNHEINLIFCLDIKSKYSKIPLLLWLPDFQHIHLPDMFTEVMRIARNRA